MKLGDLLLGVRKLLHTKGRLIVLSRLARKLLQRKDFENRALLRDDYSSFAELFVVIGDLDLRPAGKKGPEQ
jgi:protein-arginine kinase activator protein McsA